MSSKKKAKVKKKPTVKRGIIKAVGEEEVQNLHADETNKVEDDWVLNKEHLLQANLLTANLSAYKESIERRRIEVENIRLTANQKIEKLNSEILAVQRQIVETDKERKDFFASIKDSYGGIEFEKPGVTYDDKTGVIKVRPPVEVKV
jgi:hypothetical protein